MTTMQKRWLDAARRAMTRSERAEAAGDLAEAEAQLTRAGGFITRAQENLAIRPGSRIRTNDDLEDDES